MELPTGVFTFCVPKLPIFQIKSDDLLQQH